MSYVDVLEGISLSTECEGISVVASGSNAITLEGILAVQAAVMCTGTYAIRLDDVNALEASSTVTASATDADGNAVDATYTAVVSLDQARSEELHSFYTSDHVLV